jgi:hypothetical protein
MVNAITTREPQRVIECLNYNNQPLRNDDKINAIQNLNNAWVDQALYVNTVETSSSQEIYLNEYLSDENVEAVFTNDQYICSGHKITTKYGTAPGLLIQHKFTSLALQIPVTSNVPGFNRIIFNLICNSGTDITYSYIDHEKGLNISMILQWSEKKADGNSDISIYIGKISDSKSKYSDIQWYFDGNTYNIQTIHLGIDLTLHSDPGGLTKGISFLEDEPVIERIKPATHFVEKVWQGASHLVGYAYEHRSAIANGLAKVAGFVLPLALSFL